MKNKTIGYLCLFSLIPAVIFISTSCARRSVPTIAQGEKSIRIMTYNTHHCNPPSKPGVIDVDAIAEVIKKEEPDIVALQEIDVNTARSGKINEAAAIALKAGFKTFYFGKAIDFDSGEYGVAILSKYPFSNTATHRLPTDETSRGEHRVMATATVQLPNGKNIQFGCTHLDAQKTDTNRLMQIKEIVRIADKTKLPFIIAGDFNSTPGGKVIDILDQHFSRTCIQCPPTINEDGNKIAIDFIAYKPANGFTVRSHKALEGKNASDHDPVVAVLEY